MKLLIGIGNRYCRDDGAGLAVAESLRGRVPADTRVLLSDGDAAALLETWQGAELAVVVDAAAGAPPGTVLRLGADEGPLPASLRSSSTHALGLAQAVELARALGQLPRRLIIYALAGADFSAGEGLSPALRPAVAEAAGRILEELRRADLQRGGAGASSRR